MNGSKVEELQKKRAKIDSEIKIAKGKANEQKRKNETRKKILIGALIMKRMKENEIEDRKIKAALDIKLTKDSDRALFDLPPKIRMRR
jgi:hypothetical protein